MKRLLIAINAFRIIMLSKDISLELRYGKKNDLNFEKGCFADTANFLSELRKRDNFPDYVLNQYKEVLTDYSYKNHTNS